MSNNRPPDNDFMKSFSCLCFVTNTFPHKIKFDIKSFKYIFLGYLPGKKAYKAYDIQSHKIYISRDIIFFENIFPYVDQSSPSSSLPVIDILVENVDPSDSLSSSILLSIPSPLIINTTLLIIPQLLTTLVLPFL